MYLVSLLRRGVDVKKGVLTVYAYRSKPPNLPLQLIYKNEKPNDMKVLLFTGRTQGSAIMTPGPLIYVSLRQIEGIETDIHAV